MTDSELLSCFKVVPSNPSPHCTHPSDPSREVCKGADGWLGNALTSFHLPFPPLPFTSCTPHCTHPFIYSQGVFRVRMTDSDLLSCFESGTTLVNVRVL